MESIIMEFYGEENSMGGKILPLSPPPLAQPASLQAIFAQVAVPT